MRKQSVVVGPDQQTDVHLSGVGTVFSVKVVQDGDAVTVVACGHDGEQVMSGTFERWE